MPSAELCFWFWCVVRSLFIIFILCCVLELLFQGLQAQHRSDSDGQNMITEQGWSFNFKLRQMNIAVIQMEQNMITEQGWSFNFKLRQINIVVIQMGQNMFREQECSFNFKLKQINIVVSVINLDIAGNIAL